MSTEASLRESLQIYKTLEEFLPVDKERLGNNKNIEQEEIIKEEKEKKKKTKKVTYADIVRNGGG